MKWDDDEGIMAEDRKTFRYQASVGRSIRYRYEHTHQQYGAALIDYGDGGVCFQTGYEMTPGQRILVFHVSDNTGCEDNGLTCDRLGLIKWCHRMAHADAFFYKVGVAFID